MTVTELQILLDLSYGNELNVLEEHASLMPYYGSWLFVDSEDGQCYIFDKNGKIDDVKKMKALYSGYVKKDIKKIIILENVKKLDIGHFSIAHL